MVLGADSKAAGVGEAQAVKNVTRENPRTNVKMHFMGAKNGCDCKDVAPKKGVAGERPKA